MTSSLVDILVEAKSVAVYHWTKIRRPLRVTRKGSWFSQSKFLFLGLMGCVLLALVGCQAAIAPHGQTMSVSRVVSGQTVEVVDLNGQPSAVPVRLIGVAAPDLRQQPWGTDAQQALQTLVGSKTVVLETDLLNEDGYGRKLGYLWLDGMLINEWLIKQGLVLADSRSPNTKYDDRLTHAQANARLQRMGIWDSANPMRETPTEFRQRNPS